MVLRKPVPQGDLVPRPLSQAANNPPYPITPTTEHPPTIPSSFGEQELYSPDLNTSPAFHLQPLQDAQNKKNDDESDYSDSDWDKSDDEDTSPEDLPNPLKIGNGKPLPASANKHALPDALRAGPPPGVPFQKPLEPESTGATAASWGAVSNSSGGSIPLKTNNPYLRMQPTGQSAFGGESSEQIWGNTPAHSQVWGEGPSHASAQVQAQQYGELAELPSYQTPDTPTNRMGDLALNGNTSQHSSSEQAAIPQQPPQPPPPPPQQQVHTHSIDQPPLIAVESPTPQSANPRHDSNASDTWNPGMDVSSLDALSRAHGLPDNSTHDTMPQKSWQEQQAWDQSEKERNQRELAAAQEVATQAEREHQHAEEFHRAEQAAKQTPQSSPFDEEPGPTLPPRNQEEHPPPMPPRPIDTAVSDPSRAGLESPNAVMNRQRKEHYQIKHIRWYDANIRSIRTSPILTQNINGPCPLLALVNALSLSTPPGVKTEFIETLRIREQVSLGLLLDAVFEELMSGRRGGAAQELPDVNALYTFLLGLHTGLNVNPVYVQDPTATDGSSALTSGLSGRPGGFENSKDMQLYRTFDIPLFHGWLPEPGSDAYIAFDRVAKSYETAQYVQFQEEELDAKLQMEGLNQDEQRLFTDIHAIKEFLDRWPTQLTDYGVRTIRDYLKPGQIAILFRNDHFTTLYKNPHTNELMTLVTDQGYSTHDEIVWESLVDVTGQGSELYSGDFRAVGNNSNPQRQPEQQQQIQNLLDIEGDQGWTTVHNRRGDNHATSSTVNASNNTEPISPSPEANKTEQEDHDLALALQLQEEEDDRHRRSLEERRRREDRLSEQAIASQSQARPGNRRASRPGEAAPAIPPRRSNIQHQSNDANNESAPPPTYEEASTNPPYHPPQGHPANPSAPLQPNISAYQSNTANISPGQGGRRPTGRPMSIPQLQGRPGRRHSAGVTGPNGQEERDKCIMM